MDYWGGGKGVRIPPLKLLEGEGGKWFVAPFQTPPLPDPLFIRLRVFHERLSVCVFASSPYGFEGGMWDLIFIPDHCLSIYFN